MSSTLILMIKIFLTKQQIIIQRTMQLKTIKKKENNRRATMTIEANFNNCQKISLVNNKSFDFVCLFRLIIHNLKLFFKV